VLYIGMTLNVFTVMSVLSIFFFRKREGWQKLPAVSFLYPLFPVLFSVVGIWLTYQGIVLKPWIALATFLTLLTGAAVYHFKLRQRAPEAPAIETY
jgi:basic amino acid/polyamine antiporter, APA family